MLRAARGRRVAYLETQLEEVREALHIADIANLDQEQARKSLGILNASFEHLVEAIRKEYEKPLEDAHGGGVLITADDLRAAQRELERQEAERAKAAGSVQGDEQGDGTREERSEGAGWRGQQSAGVTGSGLECRTHNRPQRRTGPLLLVCLGAGAGDPFDLGVPAGAGLESMRVREVVSAKFSSSLRRERGLGRAVKLLHVEQPTSAAGIVFPNIQRDGAWLRRQLSGVRVLLLAQHAGKEAADWFDGIPYVVTVGEEIDAGAARVFKEHFWQAIGQGQTGDMALAEALAQCLEGTDLFVRGYASEGVEE